MDMTLPTDVETVVSQLAEVMEIAPDELAPDDDLFIAGLDSVRLMLLIDRWSALGVDLDPTQLLYDPTPRGFWEAIKHAAA